MLRQGVRICTTGPWGNESALLTSNVLSSEKFHVNSFHLDGAAFCYIRHDNSNLHYLGQTILFVASLLVQPYFSNNFSLQGVRKSCFSILLQHKVTLSCGLRLKQWNPHAQKFNAFIENLVYGMVNIHCTIRLSFSKHCINCECCSLSIFIVNPKRFVCHN